MTTGKYSDIKFPIYMDYQATTPVDPQVLEAMMPYFTTKFGNAHSRTHIFGWESEEAVEKARGLVADLIGASEKEIIFTSGATESNNTAIQGVARYYRDNFGKKHIVTLSTEHKCVIDTCRHLEMEGMRVTYLPVKPDGLVDLSILRDAITSDTSLVSIMAVNNEIGVIQPLAEIGRICREKNVFFHSDIAQAFGKIDINVNEMNIDLASISGHKIYGPKGIGALYLRKKPRVRLSSLMYGGGQERGVRSGTLATPLIVGLGEASRIAKERMQIDGQHVKELYECFVNTMFNKLERVYLNGSATQRYYGNVNMSFAYVEGESLILGIKELAVSSGSACTSASLEPSYVLRSLGISDDLAHTSIRFGFGRFTTMAEIEYACEAICKKVNHLRNMSPLWEMAQDGIDISKIEWATH